MPAKGAEGGVIYRIPGVHARSGVRKRDILSPRDGREAVVVGVDYFPDDFFDRRFRVAGDVVDLPVFPLVEDFEDRGGTVFDVEPLTGLSSGIVYRNFSSQTKVSDGPRDELFRVLTGAVTVGRTNESGTDAVSVPP